MKLTKIEQETIILFNEEEKTATIDTCNKSLQRKLDGFASKSSEISLIRKDENASKYVLPKKWIKVKMPNKISEEERAKRRELARQRFHRGVTHG